MTWFGSSYDGLDRLDRLDRLVHFDRLNRRSWLAIRCIAAAGALILVAGEPAMAIGAPAAALEAPSRSELTAPPDSLATPFAGTAGQGAFSTDPVAVEGVVYTELLADSRVPGRWQDRLALAREIERRAREHLERRPGDPDLQWIIVAAMAFQVDDESTTGKVRVTRRIFDEIQLLGDLAPHHPGYHHAMGRLHAGVMRISRVLRWAAVRLVGGDAMRDASWEEAEQHLRIAVELEPGGASHQLELALILQDRGQEEEARELLRGAVAAEAGTPLEAQAQARAEQLLTSVEE